MSKDLYVWGTGGHAKSLAEIAMASGFQIRAFISPNSDFQTFLGFNAYQDLPKGLAPTNAVIAIGIGDNFTRQKVWVELNKTYPISMFPPLIHPSASIAKDSEHQRHWIKYMCQRHWILIQPQSSPLLTKRSWCA
mgnify:CR=1 FL=1